MRGLFGLQRQLTIQASDKASSSFRLQLGCQRPPQTMLAQTTSFHLLSALLPQLNSLSVVYQVPSALPSLTNHFLTPSKCRGSETQPELFTLCAQSTNTCRVSGRIARRGLELISLGLRLLHYFYLSCPGCSRHLESLK